MYFQQTFAYQDLAVIGLLVVLEGVLSIDNALVLGLLAKRLPLSQRARALTYGLIGAFGFRFLAIATAQWLLKKTIVKLLGGGYLLYVALKYFWDKWRSSGEKSAEDSAHGSDGSGEAPGEAKFWPTVFVIELTDIAFAVDSILAAIALVGAAPSGHVGPHPKLWVVVSGGMLGVVLMRYAAAVFIKLLERFPRFETAAYLLVAVIGGKLTLDWAFNSEKNTVLNFHSTRSLAFWVFWLVMLASFCIGFLPSREKNDPKKSGVPFAGKPEGESS